MGVIKTAQESFTDKVIPEHIWRSERESQVSNCYKSIAWRRNNKGKCKCTYHVLRRARSQIFGYSKLNEMESQRNIGHKVGRKKVYIRAVFYFEPLERLIKRKWMMRCFKMIFLSSALRVEFRFKVSRIGWLMLQ